MIEVVIPDLLGPLKVEARGRGIRRILQRMPCSVTAGEHVRFPARALVEGGGNGPHINGAEAVVKKDRMSKRRQLFFKNDRRRDVHGTGDRTGLETKLRAQIEQLDWLAATERLGECVSSDGRGRLGR